MSKRVFELRRRIFHFLQNMSKHRQSLNHSRKDIPILANTSNAKNRAAEFRQPNIVSEFYRLTPILSSHCTKPSFKSPKTVSQMKH